MWGTRYYSRLSDARKNQLVAGLNIIGTLIPLALCSGRVAHPSLITPLLGLWGVCWALPFFVPPGLFALSLSRPHAALLTNIYGKI